VLSLRDEGAYRVINFFAIFFTDPVPRDPPVIALKALQSARRALASLISCLLIVDLAGPKTIIQEPVDAIRCRLTERLLCISTAFWSFHATVSGRGQHKDVRSLVPTKIRHLRSSHRIFLRRVTTNVKSGVTDVPCFEESAQRDRPIPEEKLRRGRSEEVRGSIGQRCPQIVS
jgi:hypothetical protein